MGFPGHWRGLLRWLPLAAIGGALALIWRRIAMTGMNAAVVYSEPPTPSVSTPLGEIHVRQRLAYGLLIAAMGVAFVRLMTHQQSPHLGLAFMVLVAMVIKKPRVLAAGAAGLMIDSVISFQSIRQSENFDVPVILMLLGIGALWASMYLDWQPSRIPSLPLPLPKALTIPHWSEVHVGMFLLGLVALAELVRVNAVPGLTGQDIAESVDTQHTLLVASFVLIVSGIGGARWPQRLPTIPWPTVIVLVGIMTLALATRFWQLHDTARFFIDELFFADNIRYLWASRNIPLLIPFNGVAAEPVLFPYWQSITVELFGRNFVGLRAASAIIGTLTVGATYLLGRALFDRKTAMLGALLLATFPPHVHFSRIGLSEIAMTLFGTLALAFLACGVMTNRRLDYALGGAMLGMTHYFHEGGKLLYTPLAVVWLVAAWVLWRPRLSVKNVLVAGVTCFIIALPIYSSILASQKPLAARMVDNAAGLSGAYWQQLFESGDFWHHTQYHLLPPFLLYIQRWDLTLYYGGAEPMMRVFSAPLFLLGAFYAVPRWRAPGPLLLILWVLTTSLGNSLLVDSASVPRFVVVFPALMLLVAVGIRYTLPLIWPEQAGESLRLRFQQVTAAGRTLLIPRLNTRQAQLLVMAALAVGISINRIGYYFNVHLPLYNQQYRDHWGHRDAQDAVLRSLDFPPGTQIHIFTLTDPPDRNVTVGMLEFMVSDLDLYLVPTRTTAVPEYIAILDHSVDNAFYVGPYNTHVIEALRSHFDLLPPQLSPYNVPADQQFVLFYAPGRTQ